MDYLHTELFEKVNDSSDGKSLIFDADFKEVDMVDEVIDRNLPSAWSVFVAICGVICLADIICYFIS